MALRNSSGFSFVAIPFIIVVLLLTGGGFYLFSRSHSFQAGSPVATKACSEDLKVCPDGKKLTRQGPQCDFVACPPIEKSQAIRLVDFKKVLLGSSLVSGKPGCEPSVRISYFDLDGDGQEEALVIYYPSSCVSPNIPATAEAKIYKIHVDGSLTELPVDNGSLFLDLHKNLPVGSIISDNNQFGIRLGRLSRRLYIQIPTDDYGRSRGGDVYVYYRWDGSRFSVETAFAEDSTFPLKGGIWNSSAFRIDPLAILRRVKNWKTFRDEEFGFEIAYPCDLDDQTCSYTVNQNLLYKISGVRLPPGAEYYKSFFDSQENSVQLFMLGFIENTLPVDAKTSPRLFEPYPSSQEKDQRISDLQTKGFFAYDFQNLRQQLDLSFGAPCSVLNIVSRVPDQDVLTCTLIKLNGTAAFRLIIKQKGLYVARDGKSQKQSYQDILYLIPRGNTRWVAIDETMAQEPFWSGTFLASAPSPQSTAELFSAAEEVVRTISFFKTETELARTPIGSISENDFIAYLRRDGRIGSCNDFPYDTAVIGGIQYGDLTHDGYDEALVSVRTCKLTVDPDVIAVFQIAPGGSLRLLPIDESGKRLLPQFENGQYSKACAFSLETGALVKDCGYFDKQPQEDPFGGTFSKTTRFTWDGSKFVVSEDGKEYLCGGFEDTDCRAVAGAQLGIIPFPLFVDPYGQKTCGRDKYIPNPLSESGIYQSGDKGIISFYCAIPGGGLGSDVSAMPAFSTIYQFQDDHAVAAEVELTELDDSMGGYLPHPYSFGQKGEITRLYTKGGYISFQDGEIVHFKWSGLKLTFDYLETVSSSTIYDLDPVNPYEPKIGSYNTGDGDGI